MLQTKEEPDKGPKTGRVWPTVGQARKSWGDVGGGRSVGPRKPLEGFGFTWDEMGGRWKVR